MQFWRGVGDGHPCRLFAAVLGGYFPGFSLHQHWEGCEGEFSPELSMKQGRRTWRHGAQPSSALIFITNKDPVQI